MSTRRVLPVILAASVLVLAMGIGPQPANSAYAEPVVQSTQPAGTTIPYPGRLNDAAGNPVPNGAYDFAFTLYASQTGGEPLWSETQQGVTVQDGAFLVSLGRAQAIPAPAADSKELWLAVGVRGPGEADFTDLAPRQRLTATASTSLDSPKAGPSCPHDHAGEGWRTAESTGLWVESTSGEGTGIEGLANIGTGAWGVYGYSSHGIGVRGSTDDGIAVDASGWGRGRDKTSLRVVNGNTNGGQAAYIWNTSGWATAHLQNGGGGEVLYLQANGGYFLRAVNNAESDTKFRMEYNGQAYADGSWNSGGADFAEMMPGAVGLTPGEVLVIAPDGELARSSEPYQTSVAGVYSTNPGFVGGQPADGKATDTIPLAMVGVVPAKVSAENGAVRPGNLLVTSSVPGHAMRAGADPPQGTVIGKALGKLETGTGVIKILVTLQ